MNIWFEKYLLFVEHFLCDFIDLLCGFPGGSDSKACACNAGDPASILGLRRSPGEGNGNALQYSCLENPIPVSSGRLQSMGLQSQTWLSNFTFFTMWQGFYFIFVNCEEGWVPKNWWFWTMVLEKTLESPLDCKEIQTVHSEGDQPWDFFGRNDAKAETPVLWPPHAKSWLTGKDSDAGRDWGQEEKGMTKDKMAGWHHRLDGRECEWTPGVGDGQGGLACCNSWGRKELDTTELLNWAEQIC